MAAFGYRNGKNWRIISFVMIIRISLLKRLLQPKIQLPPGWNGKKNIRFPYEKDYHCISGILPARAKMESFCSTMICMDMTKLFVKKFSQKNKILALRYFVIE